MKKTLRKKFVLFAMSAVTVLLVVLIGAIDGFSWIILDRQSDDILHTLVSVDEKFPPMEFREPRPFAPPMNMDTSYQLSTFVMIFSVSTAIAFMCWLLILLFVVLLSKHVVRPILAGIEKQKQFITNAGHELKTPLAIIQSNNDAATLIYGESKYSKNIRTQTKRLNVLMTNLLTLAKLDEETKLPTEYIDISELISGMLSIYEDAVAEKQIAFSSSIQPHVFLQVHWDTFSQMISILLDNAVKYTPEGGTIRFSVMNVGGHVEITEENTCEMPSGSDPERLFERFYRGDSVRTQSNPSSGYGIGLSAARAIAETFGGKLTAEYTATGEICFIARF